MSANRLLVIRENERADIKAAIDRAMANPITWEQTKEFARPMDKKVLKLSDRSAKFRPRSEMVLIPHGYCAMLSFEEQPNGMVRHLSVSVDTVGMLPSEAAFVMIAKEFGFSWPPKDGGWLEEFEPNHYAVNIIEACKATQ